MQTLSSLSLGVYGALSLGSLFSLSRCVCAAGGALAESGWQSLRLSGERGDWTEWLLGRYKELHTLRMESPIGTRMVEPVRGLSGGPKDVAPCWSSNWDKRESNCLGIGRE